MRDWTFAAPERLWLLAVLGALAVVALLMRRRAGEEGYATPELRASVQPHRLGWRGPASAAGLALGATALTVGFAQPSVLAEPLDERSVVVVALDTSTSMALGDVRPDRFTVAKDAAQEFVRDLPDDVEVGLVTFNTATALVASPTDDHEAVARAIADLTMAGGTAAGDGLVLAVDSAVAEVGAAAPATGPVAQVVLLADGASSVGLPLEQAAQRAADARVQVSTIAFGTPDLEVFYTPGVATDVGVDLEALQQVADVTGGTAYAAPTSEALRDAYDDVGAAIDLAPRREDVSDLAAGLGVLALFAGAVPALLWTSRLA